MGRSQTVLFAAGVLIVGTVGAFAFRKPAAEPPAPHGAAAESLALRGESPSAEGDAPGATRLTGRISALPAAEQVTETSHPLADESTADKGSSWYDGSSWSDQETANGVTSPFDSNWPRTMPNSTPSQSVSSLATVVGASDSTRSGRVLRTHVIRDGDTLSRLANRFLGDSRRFNEIYEANREVLASPDLLPIGTQLTIPPRQPTSQSVGGDTPQPAPLVPVEADRQRRATRPSWTATV